MSNMTEVRVTTTDNPYDPFTHWDEWLLFDTTMGYYTCQRLASITIVSDQLSDEENRASVEDGIGQLVKYGAISKQGDLIEYKKVEK